MSRHPLPSHGIGDARHPAGAALDAANEAFHEAYDHARCSERHDGPVFVVLSDELVVFRADGTRRSVAMTPHVFHVIKSAAHVPVAVFAAIDRQADHAPLQRLREHVDRSLALLPDRNAVFHEESARHDENARHDERALQDESARHDEKGVDGETLDAIRAVLEESRAFLDRVLAGEGGPARKDLDAFAHASGKRLLHLTRLATRVQLEGLHEVVERLLGELDHEGRQRLQVIVTGNHQARARSLGMQYFRKRLREAEGAEDRVAYAEGIDDAAEALALVGTRRMDARIARAFFGDSKRLQRDVLGDAVEELLSRTDLDPIA